jgi:hypothetical protein
MPKYRKNGGPVNSSRGIFPNCVDYSATVFQNTLLASVVLPIRWVRKIPSGQSHQENDANSLLSSLDQM